MLEKKMIKLLNIEYIPLKAYKNIYQRKKVGEKKVKTGKKKWEFEGYKGKKRVKTGRRGTKLGRKESSRMYTPTLQTENMTQVYQTEIRTERCNELSFVYCLGLVNQMRSWTSSPATSRSASSTIIPSSWSSTVYSKCLAACKTQNQVVFKHYLQSNFVFYEIEILISVLRIWNSNFSQDPDPHAFQIGLFFLPFIHCCNWTWVVG